MNLLLDFSSTTTSSPVGVTPITSLLDLTPIVSTIPLVTPSLTSTSPSMTSDIIYQVSKGGNFDLPNLQNSGIISQKILGKNLQPNVNQSLHEDDNVRVSFVKVLDTNTSSVAIFSSNKSALDITELQFTITCPPSLKLVPPTDGSFTVVDTNTPNSLKLRLRSLPPGATCVLVSELQLLTWEFNLTTTVAISYNIDDRVQYGRFQLPIVPTDFIRSHVIPIQTYGSNWKSFPKTASHTIPNKTIGTENYKKIISESNFGVIDVKGIEVVSCARLLPIGGSSSGGNPEIILLYGKVAQGQLVITLKALNQIHVDTVGTVLKQVFTNK